jgi:hypothetical protein
MLNLYINKDITKVFKSFHSDNALKLLKNMKINLKND